MVCQPAPGESAGWNTARITGLRAVVTGPIGLYVRSTGSFSG